MNDPREVFDDESFEILLKGLKEVLLADGFPYVYDWYEAPGTTHPVHAHKGRVVMFIAQGDVMIKFGQVEVPLVAGARFDAPVNEAHSAVVGPEGCTYVVGEMIEGDS